MKWITDASPISFPSLGIEINPPLGFGTDAFEIRFYGLLIALGLLLAAVYGLRRKKVFGLTEDEIIDGALCIIPFAIICARAYYCIFAWDEYAANPISVLYIWNGGLAIYGGVIGAAIGIVVYCRVKKIPIGTCLDITSLGFLIGQAIGRWGNFFNREAFGAKTESFLRMGLKLTEDGRAAAQMYYYHPTFLYESVWNAMGFVLLHNFSKRRKCSPLLSFTSIFVLNIGASATAPFEHTCLHVASVVSGVPIPSTGTFVEIWTPYLLSF